jgi:4-hydroxy-3-methylbut-2-enyl diphosphate reductase
VELCEENMPTYFIRDADEFDAPTEIHHFDVHEQEEVATENWFPADDTPVDVLLTSGASCPDALLDDVVRKIVSWFPEARPVEEAVAPFEEMTEEDDE